MDGLPRADPVKDPLGPVVAALYDTGRNLVEQVPFETVVAWPDDALRAAWHASKSAQNVFDVARIYTPVDAVVRTTLAHLELGDDPFHDMLQGAIDSLRESINGRPDEAIRAHDDSDALITTARVMGLSGTWSRGAAIHILSKLVLRRPTHAFVWAHLVNVHEPAATRRRFERAAVVVPTWQRIMPRLETR